MPDAPRPAAELFRDVAAFVAALAPDAEAIEVVYRVPGATKPGRLIVPVLADPGGGPDPFRDQVLAYLGTLPPGAWVPRDDLAVALQMSADAGWFRAEVARLCRPGGVLEKGRGRVRRRVGA